MEDYYTNRNTMHRYFVDKVHDDGGDVQMRDVTGIDSNDKLTQVLHVQPHGFSSVSPIDSHMVGVPIGNQRDLVMLLGGEHPGSRAKYAKGQNPGDSVLYNADGSVWKMVGKSPSFNCPGTCTLTAQSFVFKCGANTLTMDSSGWKFTGGRITHDDHDIGKTHMHTKTQPGGGLTGEPQ